MFEDTAVFVKNVLIISGERYEIVEKGKKIQRQVYGIGSLPPDTHFTKDPTKARTTKIRSSCPSATTKIYVDYNTRQVEAHVQGEIG